MSHVVAKDFKSINRRFKAGDPISASDIDPGSAASFEALCERAFITVSGTDADQPAPAEAATKAD